MKFITIIILISLMLLSGCRTYSRYRTGGELMPKEAKQDKGKFSTNEYLRMGKIMQSYLGKPYKGKSKYEKGLDCSFFTSEVYRKFNKTIIPRTVKEQYKTGKNVPFKRLLYGDLLFFKTEGRKVSHVGIFVGDGKFMHTTNSRGVIISSLSEKYWSKRYVGARRVFLVESSNK